MRTRAAVLVLSAAATLGSLAGAFVLPDRGAEVGGSPPPTTSSPPASKSVPTRPSASPSPGVPDGVGSVTGANLLGDADLRRAGLTITRVPVESRLELVSCNGKHDTLDAVAESGPPVQRGWGEGPVIVYQQAIAARDGEEAAEIVTRVLRRFAACQRAAPGEWVYTPTHTEKLGPATTASWLGSVDGQLNTTGRAPAGEKINGGVAVMRRGHHVSVLTITWCAGEGESDPCGGTPVPHAYGRLVALSRAAALRLG